MSKSLYFLLGVHSHQPVGNFDHVFQKALDKAYRPFLDLLMEHPTVKVSLHYSGVLLEWIEHHQPKFLDILRTLVKRGQVEMMSGGFYEPILPIIPEQDAQGQIALLNTWLKEKTGYQPAGTWLTERVWEPHLPRLLNQCGIRYTVVDDFHFKCSGLSEEETYGYYLTEELGDEIAIFPSNEKLRYGIPFALVEQSLDFFNDLATEDGTRVIVLGDDGEKFGIWPGTYKHCYTDGWLDDFFKMLEDNTDTIKLCTFAEIMQKVQPRGRVYLPTASYREMMEWAMPPESIHRYKDLVKMIKEHGLKEELIFVRGGFWRGFLSKYPESNNIHKKMLYVSKKVHEYEDMTHDEATVDKALKCLWKGQCNCGYWHGVFGGLYLPHLRNALYENLIEAEKVIEQPDETPQQWCKVRQFDFDVDGHEEIIIETDRQNLYITPVCGGALIEHDYKPASLNLIDTLARREEAYHAEITTAQVEDEDTAEETSSIHKALKVKEKGLEKLIFYDWYRKMSLLDHFPRIGTTLKQFATCRYSEDGDFVIEPYEVHKIENDEKTCRIELSRTGECRKEDSSTKVKVTKALRVESGSDKYRVDYLIENLSPHRLENLFGVEFNVNVQAGKSPDRYYFVNEESIGKPQLASSGEHSGVEVFGIVDEWRKVRIECALSKKATLWRFPIETVSLSEGGLERVYQGSTLFPFWTLNLKAGETQVFQIICRIVAL